MLLSRKSSRSALLLMRGKHSCITRASQQYPPWIVANSLPRPQRVVVNQWWGELMDWLVLCLCAVWIVVVTGSAVVDDPKSLDSHRELGPSYSRHAFVSNQNTVEIERSIMTREKQRVDQLVTTLRNVHGYDNIQGFYHTSRWRKYWKEVISEQLYLLDGRRPIPEKNYPRYTNKIPWDMENRYTSLLNISTGLFLNIVGDDESHKKDVINFVQSLDLVDAKKIQFNFNRTITRYRYDSAKGDKRKALDDDPQLSCGEYSTIMQMRDYCIDQVRAGKRSLVYYMHSKGQCCQRNATDVPPQNDGVTAWREYMNAMIVEFPSICLRAMMKGYLACGVENQDMHYSGNYWWADCSHVAQLPPLKSRWDFGAPEFFVLRFHEDFGLARQLGFQCGYSIFNCGVNLYDVACTRDRYRERLNKYVHFKLGPNSVKGKNENLDVCKNLVKEFKPYSERKDELKAWYHERH